MTTKETDSELNEIFSHKAALTDKINHNTKVVYQLEKAVKEERGPAAKAELKRTSVQYNGALDNQIKERQKLSIARIAAQLDVKKGLVRRRYMTFLGNRSLCE